MNGANAKRAAASPDPLQQSDSAAYVIEGEEYAIAYLDRIRTGLAQPDDLAVIVAFLRGAMLAGFCRLMHQVLEARHHA